MTTTPIPPFHLLIKPAGAACNLGCEYCFYLGKDTLYSGSSLRMNDQVLHESIRQVLEAQGQGETSIAWQGGEPTLMGLGFFQRSVQFARELQQQGQQITYTLQTNGTLLDDDWCAFFREEQFLIGLSMDGPPPLHNVFRREKGGAGTHERVRQAWDLLQRHGVETNILCTVNSANASHPLEVYRFFRDELHARFIQFIPIVVRREAGRLTGGKDDRPVSAASVDPEEFGSFLSRIFDEWIRRDVGRVFVQAFDSALAAWYRVPPGICVHQESCGRSLVLEHNGDLYSCDHFVDPAHRLGNILETPMTEMVQSKAQQHFGLEKRERLPRLCRECDVFFACQGECPRNRFMQSPNDETGLNYLCVGYRQFFHHIDRPMRQMANLLDHGSSPAEIMVSGVKGSGGRSRHKSKKQAAR